MGYQDLATLHNPAPGLVAPATWGDQVRDNDEYFKANAAQKIAETILGAAAASITFSSIPATFRHLRLEVVARGDAALTEVQLRLRFNGDTGANYDWIASAFLEADAQSTSEAVADTFIGLGSNIPAANAPASHAGVVSIFIGDYARTQWHKSAHGMSFHMLAASATNLRNVIGGGRWRSTAAITSLVIPISSGNYTAGSIFTLWGLP